jgi:hypothetical protein
MVLITHTVSLAFAPFAHLVAGKHPDMKKEIQQHMADDLRQRLVVVALGSRAEVYRKTRRGCGY